MSRTGSFLCPNKKCKERLQLVGTANGETLGICKKGHGLFELDFPRRKVIRSVSNDTTPDSWLTRLRKLLCLVK